MHPRFRFLAVRLSLLALDVSLVIAGVIGVLSLLGRSEVAFAVGSTRYVATTGTDSGICTSSGSPCRTIQYAVDQAAASGDTILVATGTYTTTNVRPRNDIVASGNVTQVVYITKTLTLHGGYATSNWVTSFPITQPTTIDAQNKGRGVYIVNGAAVTVQGFHITRGNPNGMGGGLSTSDHAGGGIYAHAASLNLIDNTIFSNTAEAGGGIYLHTIALCFICTGNSILTNTATISGGGLYIKDSNSAAFVSNTIRANSSITEGGGIFFDNSDVTFQDGVIESNSSRTGGGIVLRSSAATINDNDILKNSASSVGGGLEIIGSNVNLVNNRIYSNTANVGGGLQVGSSSGASFTNNVIRYNQAFFNGGGIDFATSGAALVRNNVIADNQASSKGSGALVTNSSPRFEHNTFARNTGGDGTAIHAAGGAGTNVVMTNTIFVTQTLAITVSTGSTVSVKTGLSFGNTTFCGGAGSCSFTNLHTGNPVFDTDGYHLRPGSQAIDNGLTSGVTTDIDGDTRPIGSAPDIGADEFDPTAATGTRYVAKTGTNTSNDCTLTSLPCLTIQYAVDLAKTNEEVRVAAGTYTGIQVRPRLDVSASGTVTQVVYITRSVTIGGGYTTTNWTTPNPLANVTTIDAQNLGRGIYIAGTSTVKVTGFTITRGNAKNQGGQPFLGTSNSAGGGIYIITATATITGNTLTNNDAGNQGAITTKGGGIYFQSVSSGVIGNNSVISNTAVRGGGLYLNSSPATVSLNNILSNTVVVGSGGGIVTENSAATLSHNTIMSNSAPEAGGVYVTAGNTPVLDSNLIMRNKAGGNGAGLYVNLTNGQYTNNVIADNVITNATGSGSGVFVYGGSPRFIHTTLARNSGGNGSGVLIDDNGLGTYSSVVLTNTILVNHSAGISVTAGNTATINSILFFGNTINTGGGGAFLSSNVYTGNPAFDTDGYHLTSGSAAIDQGISTTVTTDLDGDSRPSGLAPDLGADELGAFFIYLPIVLED